jgi:hypothetical protein
LVAGPNQRLHVAIIANGEDGIAGKGDGLLDGARGIGGVDLAVAENDVGLAVPAGWRGCQPEA